ncbi:MAG: TauD/TfdA family dioxygenase [Thalassobaculum sp.]
MSHFTSRPFTYVQEWRTGDLVIYDNRCTIHSATWFDGDAVDRVMWRTTVRGNPGPEYADEQPSWLPAA